MAGTKLATACALCFAFNACSSNSPDSPNGPGPAAVDVRQNTTTVDGIQPSALIQG